jgi:hypothetical protein
LTKKDIATQIHSNWRDLIQNGESGDSSWRMFWRLSILAQAWGGIGISPHGNWQGGCCQCLKSWKRGLSVGLAGVQSMCTGEAGEKAGKAACPRTKGLWIWTRPPNCP